MNAVPPKISRVAPMNIWFAGIILSLAGLGGCAMVFFFNPTTHAFYPVCQFHKLTGLNCPGCGATRALYALLHGNISTALRDNALFVLALAVAALAGNLACPRENPPPARRGAVPKHWVWPFLVIALVFTVLRNLPVFSFLSPA